MIHILQKVPDVCIAALFIIAATLVPAAGAPAAIDARDLVFRSAGTQDGSGGWNLASNSYVGTFIYLSKRAAVTISVRVAGHEAEMHVHVAQSTFVQHVNHEDFRTYTYALTLPPGTYCLRVELTNAGPKSAAGLKVRSLAVSGEGVRTRNEPTDRNALDAADTYIANYRRGDAVVTLGSDCGKHLPAGAIVRVRLKRHAFNFGAAVYGFNDADWLQDNPPAGTDADHYQKFLNAHFNTIVPENAGKWTYNENTRGDVTMGFLDRMTDYARTHDMRLRMHGVLWNGDKPQWVTALENQALNGSTQQERDTAKNDLRRQITNRIDYFVRDRASRYVELDGINESLHQPAFLDIYGPAGVAGIYNDIASALDSAGSKSGIYFNEYCVLQGNRQFGCEDDYSNWYKNHIESILNAGVSSDARKRLGIGVQYYVDAGPDALKNCPHSPFRISQVLQNLSVLGFPLTLTEFATVTGCDSYAPGYLAETMPMVFGCDRMTSFLVWGFWKRQMWMNGSAMLDENWNLTETGRVYEQIMGIHDWGIAGVPIWTTDLALTTDARGRVSFKGFYGDYDVTVNGRTFPMTLTQGRTRYFIEGLCP